MNAVYVRASTSSLVVVSRFLRGWRTRDQRTMKMRLEMTGKKNRFWGNRNDKTRTKTSITPQAAGLVKSDGVKCSLMHASPSKGWLLPSRLELHSKTPRGYPGQVELESRQTHRETVAVYMLVGVRDSGIPCRSAGTGWNRNKHRKH